MGRRVYTISGGNAASSGNQNFLNEANRLPIAASQVINDSAVVGANVAAALNDLQAKQNSSSIANFSTVEGATVTDALDALLLGNSYPYIQKPATPNAFDLEFEDGLADWAALGFTIVNAATGVVQTRNGNISVWGAPPAGTYNSQCIGSWIFTQAPAGIQLDIYRTITLAAGDTYFARIAGSYCLAPAANGRFNEIGFYGASGAQLDNNNRVYTTVRDDTTTSFLQTDTTRFTAGVGGSGAGGRLALGGHDVRGIYYQSGTTHYGFQVSSQDCECHAVNITGAPAAATLVRFAIRNLFSTSGGVVPQLFAIDYIRKKTADAWLIP